MGSLDMEASSLSIGAARRRRTYAWLVLAVCLGLCGWCALGVLHASTTYWLLARSRSTQLQAHVEWPAQATVGETIDAVLTLTNNSATSLELESITIDSSMELNLAQGLELIEIDPAFIEDREETSGHYYLYAMSLAPGESKDFRLRFVALQQGTFTGMLFADHKGPQGGVSRHIGPITVETKIVSPGSQSASRSAQLGTGERNHG